MKEFSKTWLDLYVARKRNDTGRAIAKQRLRDIILPAMGSFRLSEVRPLHLEAMVVQLSKRLARRSVRHILPDVRCLFRYALHSEAI